MIKLKLNHRTYKLPKRYTVSQWKEVVRMDMEDPDNWPKILGIALNKHWYTFAKVEEDSLILGASLVISEMAKRRPCKHKDFTKISLGQFVDLDIAMINGMEKNIDTLLGELTISEVEYIDEALYIIDEYANFRISTYRSYAGLFGINQKTGKQEDVDPEEYDANKIAKGWYKVLVDLADNDIMKLDQVTEQPLYKALTFMSLRKERMLEEQQRQLKQKRQHELSRNRK